MSATRRWIAGVVVIAGLVLGGSAVAQAQGTQKAAESLYKRLGGYDALALVTDEFIGRLINDQQLTKYFIGHGAESRAHIRQMVLDQLCAVTGGPCVYVGRDMKSVHKGLGITEREWQLAVAHLVGTLDKFKVPEKEKGEVLAAVGSTKKDIVERP